MASLDLPVLLPQVKAGIEADGDRRARTGADGAEMPTTAKLGITGMIIENWYGLVARAATPPADRRGHEQDRRRSDERSDGERRGRDPRRDAGRRYARDVRAFVDSETEEWAKVIEDAGVVTTK